MCVCATGVKLQQRYSWFQCVCEFIYIWQITWQMWFCKNIYVGSMLLVFCLSFLYVLQQRNTDTQSMPRLTARGKPQATPTGQKKGEARTQPTTTTHRHSGDHIDIKTYTHRHREINHTRWRTIWVWSLK